jgi:hypothetical protein
MEQIHNLYITSTNKQGSDTNYNYNLYFSSYGINIAPDEDAYLHITSFQSLNTFYNINDNSKSFSVKIFDSEDIPFIFYFDLETGNYDIYEFQQAVNNLCSDYFTITYNANKNKWIYKVADKNYNELFIKPSKYNYKYFGLKPDEYNYIYFNGVYSNGVYSNVYYSNIINLNNFSLIVIKVLGLVEQNKTLSNFNTSISRGDVCALVNRQDNNINSLINWSDINKTFRKKICNTELNSLNFIFTDEYNNLLLELNDWLICLSITIKKKIQHQQLQ